MPNILKWIISFALSGLGIALVWKLIADSHKALKGEQKKAVRIETGEQTENTQGTFWGSTRGLRNNNPGNLRVTADKWEGMTGDDGAFVTFKSVEYGARAMLKLIINYKKKYGLDTLSKIIHRYAPINENNTSAYIDSVVKATNINVNQVLDFNSQDTLVKIAQAMCHVETGTQLPINIFHSGFLLL